MPQLPPSRSRSDRRSRRWRAAGSTLAMLAVLAPPGIAHAQRVTLTDLPDLPFARPGLTEVDVLGNR